MTGWIISPGFIINFYQQPYKLSTMFYVIFKAKVKSDHKTMFYKDKNIIVGIYIFLLISIAELDTNISNNSTD